MYTPRFDRVSSESPLVPTLLSMLNTSSNQITMTPIPKNEMYLKYFPDLTLDLKVLG